MENKKKTKHLLVAVFSTVLLQVLLLLKEKKVKN